MQQQKAPLDSSQEQNRVQQTHVITEDTTQCTDTNWKQETE